jgi:hypothetical protein
MRVPMRGQIAPLMTLQDQIDVTTFGLLVAQWWGAFRQRYVIGWTARASAEADQGEHGAADDVRGSGRADGGEGGIKVGEFGQTDLDGYIKSREASLTHAATLSQTPVHELVGELVNLSAEALAAAEQGHERKVDERKTSFSASRTSRRSGSSASTGRRSPLDAEVVWRDTSARTFAATVDGLGKLAQMLNVPPRSCGEDPRRHAAGRRAVEAPRSRATRSTQLAQIARPQTKPRAVTA